tara:strand:+ start:128 stop:589 length:462 start_codon:yes stop_codon:yes gene_type:complete
MKLEHYFKIKGTYELKNGVYNVKGDLDLIKQVEKLPVKFGIVTGNFDCHSNNLTSLEGAPKKVGGEFWCDYNNLTSLEGAPKQVGGYFDCCNNNLTSLEGCPKYIGSDFWCYKNNLTSLKGCPIKIGGDLICDDNLYNTKEFKLHLIMKELKK